MRICIWVITKILLICYVTSQNKCRLKMATSKMNFAKQNQLIYNEGTLTNEWGDNTNIVIPSEADIEYFYIMDYTTGQSDSTTNTPIVIFILLS
jgi:hypothetical protein